MGGGYNGNFGNTQGSKKVKVASTNCEFDHIKDEIPIKKPGDLRYSKKKTETYLLNTEHPEGGSKAKFFKEVLGYEISDSKLFHKNVVASIINKFPIKETTTQYGLKYEYETKLIGKNGKSVIANVTVVIQLDHGRVTHKIVTIHPREKDK